LNFSSSSSSSIFSPYHGLPKNGAPYKKQKNLPEKIVSKEKKNSWK
jgi:hypothetical protein